MVLLTVDGLACPPAYHVRPQDLHEPCRESQSLEVVEVGGVAKGFHTRSYDAAGRSFSLAKDRYLQLLRIPLQLQAVAWRSNPGAENVFY